MRFGRWLLLLLGAVVVVGLAAPSGARADGAVTLVGDQLRFNSDSQDAENLVISRASDALNCNPRPTPCLQLANGPQKISDQVAGTGCEQLLFNGQPFDTIVVCALNVATSLRLTLNDGDDFVSVGANVLPTTMDGGTGDDNLSSDSGADTMLGGAGDDLISDGGSSGNDRLDGGADNDSISLSGGNDDVTGGAGVDTVFMDSGDDTVRLDNVANDGPAGTASNVHSDVEVVDGGAGSDNLFGSAGTNTLRGGSGNDLLDGGGGPDVLDGGGGADDLSGGPDVDRVVYSDAAAQTITLDDVRNDGAAGELDDIHSDIENVAAGPGNDVVFGNDAANVIDGGDGGDRLQGGGGADTYIGGPGADALFTRDGIPERVDCGTQTDTAEADTTDLLVGCESVAVSSALVPDADGDGVSKPSDCNDDNPAIHPGAVDAVENGIDEDCSGADAVNLDRDGDGFPVPTDCNDADPSVHPGALEIRGNATDENCDTLKEPFLKVSANASLGVLFGRGFIKLVTLKLTGLARGDTVRLSCRGRGCRKPKTATIKIRHKRARLNISKRVRGARLRKRAQLTVEISHPGMIARVFRFKVVRLGQVPRRTELCRPPGAKRPGRC